MTFVAQSEMTTRAFPNCRCYLFRMGKRWVWSMYTYIAPCAPDRPRYRVAPCHWRTPISRSANDRELEKHAEVGREDNHERREAPLGGPPPGPGGLGKGREGGYNGL